ncbi:MAG: LysR family transcriptional regulator ArgP [Rubrivivax sp.]|nr:MAG: LysR family transcriptional regulator ArgP [Rubrivivax sp.]
MNDFDAAALDCLAALADEQSFDRAAQRLSITQSAVSQRLRTLEGQVGQPLVVRSRPLRLTEAGKVLLRFARQLQALRVDVALELGERIAPQSRLAIAVNADSLATWVLPALDELVQQGLREGYGLELVVDDQDFTHDSLREGAVLGCVTTVAEALQGCRVQPLGVMRYVAVASRGFLAAQLPEGLHAGNFARTPFLVFNRKDDSQVQWVCQAFGVRAPRLRERFVPSSEAYVTAAVMGWGVGVAPEIQVRAFIEAGQLVVLRPDVGIDVALYWHQWQLQGRSALLDRIGQALAKGAKRALG